MNSGRADAADARQCTRGCVGKGGRQGRRQRKFDARCMAEAGWDAGGAPEAGRDALDFDRMHGIIVHVGTRWNCIGSAGQVLYMRIGLHR